LLEVKPYGTSVSLLHGSVYWNKLIPVNDCKSPQLRKVRVAGEERIGKKDELNEFQ